MSIVTLPTRLRHLPLRDDGPKNREYDKMTTVIGARLKRKYHPTVFLGWYDERKELEALRKELK